MTGCGFVDIPDLSDEQTELISEYAVNLLLKHAQGSNERILSAEEVQKAESEAAAEEKAHANEKAGVNSKNSAKQDKENADTSSKNSSDGAAVTDTSISDFFGIQGVDIEFRDFDVCSSYPDDLSEDDSESQSALADSSDTDETISDKASETKEKGTSDGEKSDDASNMNQDAQESTTAADKKLSPSDNSSVIDSMYFSLDADPGKKLVVLNFTATNTTDKDIELNMASYSPAFSVTLDDNGPFQALTTLVPNDIASYNDTLPAGGSATMTCIVQAKEDKTASINSIVLNMKSKDNTASIKLK
jgi:hypothetical protein